MKKYRVPTSLLFLLIMNLFSVNFSYAQEAKEKAKLIADIIKADTQNNITIFKGNVTLNLTKKNKNIQAKADEIKVLTNPNTKKVSFMFMSGKPVLIKGHEKVDNGEKNFSINATKVKFDNSKNLFILEEQGLIKLSDAEQKTTEFKGKDLIFDIENENVTNQSQSKNNTNTPVEIILDL